jgi:hypothetical protein
LATAAIGFAQIAGECEQEGLSSENAARIAAELSRTFQVHDDEIAIFRLQNSQLKFVFPVRLSTVGMIPLNHTNSVAARTANTRRPEIINNLPQMKHASVFEAVPIESRTRGPQPATSAIAIQKMMSVPVLGPAGVLGVIQLSRKGVSPKAAGLDFQPTDLQKLVNAAHALAKCFK